MFRYNFWRKALNVVYWIEWWTARSVDNVESKFFKAEVDYTVGYDGWNNALEYLEDMDDTDEDDEEL